VFYVFFNIKIHSASNNKCMTCHLYIVEGQMFGFQKEREKREREKKR